MVQWCFDMLTWDTILSVEHESTTHFSPIPSEHTAQVYLLILWLHVSVQVSHTDTAVLTECNN